MLYYWWGRWENPLSLGALTSALIIAIRIHTNNLEGYVWYLIAITVVALSMLGLFYVKFHEGNSVALIFLGLVSVNWIEWGLIVANVPPVSSIIWLVAGIIQFGIVQGISYFVREYPYRMYR